MQMMLIEISARSVTMPAVQLASVPTPARFRHAEIGNEGSILPST
jgi:hypothetical protein